MAEPDGWPEMIYHDVCETTQYIPDTPLARIEAARNRVVEQVHAIRLQLPAPDSLFEKGPHD